MAIKKTDLKTFIENKIKEQRERTKENRKAWIHETIDPVIDRMFERFDFGSIERAAEKLHDAYDEILQGFPGVEYDAGSDILAKLVSLNRVRQMIREDIRSNVVSHLTSNYESYRHKHKKYCFDELNMTVAAMEGKAMEFQKRLDDLTTLEREALNIINVATSGNQAYKHLIAVGLDMSEFKETEPQLPAVVKLSVEPCLLNGGC